MSDWRPWIPIVTSALQLVLIPVILTALDYRISKALLVHNAEPHAHPALADLVDLKNRIDHVHDCLEKHAREMQAGQAELRLMIERITPRRRAADLG